MNIDILNIPLPEDLLKLKWNGQFQLMNEIIDLKIQKDIPSQLKERLILEKEIIRRLPGEFPYTKAKAIQLCKSRIRNFSEAEFDELFKDSAFEFLFVEGIIKFKNNFYENLIKTRPQYLKRLVQPLVQVENRDEIICHIKKQKDVYFRLHIKMAIKVKPEYEEIGKTVRVWLPVPVIFSPVEHVRIIKISSPHVLINDDDVYQRSVYFEEKLQHDQEFSVEFELINHIHSHDLSLRTTVNEHMKEYLEECQPHIVFTPRIICIEV